MTRATGLPEPAHKSPLCSSKSTLRSLVKSRSYFDARFHDERSAPSHISCFRSQEKPQFTLALASPATVLAPKVGELKIREWTFLWSPFEALLNPTRRGWTCEKNQVWLSHSNMVLVKFALFTTLLILFRTQQRLYFSKHLHWPLRYSTMLKSWREQRPSTWDITAPVLTCLQSVSR